MGMFDEVRLPCPCCKEYTSRQSKGGECILAEYTFPDVPQDVLSYIVGEEVDCENCGKKFIVKATFYITSN
jgi:hypothetical protein